MAVAFRLYDLRHTGSIEKVEVTTMFCFRSARKMTSMQFINSIAYISTTVQTLIKFHLLYDILVEGDGAGSLE